MEVSLTEPPFLHDGMQNLSPEDNLQQLLCVPAERLHLILTVRLRSQQGRQGLTGGLERCLSGSKPWPLFQRAQV